MQRVKGMMPFENFRNIINQIAGHEINELWLQNLGESTLHPDFPEMARYACEKGIYPVICSTNCTTLHGEFIEKILLSGIDCLVLSLDGASKMTYEKLREGADYGAVLENIKNIFSMKKRLNLATPALVVQIVHSPETADEKDAYVREWVPLLNKNDRISIKLYNDFAGRLELPLLKEKDFLLMPCSAIFENMVILWNGDTTPCCMDIEGELNTGNVFKNSIRKIWNGRQYKNLRSAVTEGKYELLELCRACTQGIGKERSVILPDSTEIIL
jgi:radical SAM protein with 4Fe4S-binding SPASM domain